ncbi:MULTISPECIES: DUF2911 domain-containing protein [Flavobacteriaceae]|uniref:DUF2911 domain-containing protein n=1 Tax=Flavobacteriaceae TaxID=49546 RepID=UPI002349F426|nr:DUF2911 domain-containing protein [Muricauda sp. SP22]MDC6362166.1 DUF2911 domain-containing protein [Muricauda sp. SP22]
MRKLKSSVRWASLFTMTVLFSMCSLAQKSPYKSVEGKAANASIEITYNSPSMRGREIFGGLVAYDKVWRAGANMATTFTTDKDITVVGEKLSAGTYALFFVPSKGDWTVIFNSNHGRSGSSVEGLTLTEYDKDNKSSDVLRVKASPKKASQAKEQLTYTVTNDGFTMEWANVVLPVAID